MSRVTLIVLSDADTTPGVTCTGKLVAVSAPDSNRIRTSPAGAVNAMDGNTACPDAFVLTAVAPVSVLFGSAAPLAFVIRPVTATPA